MEFLKPSRFWGICLIILVAVVFRLLPMPVNFSPIGAMALFAGFSFRGKLQAFLFPLTALFLSDLYLGFHETMWAVYLSFVAATAIGFFLRERPALDQPASFRQKLATRGSAVVASSLLFFVVTNFAVWAQSGLYERTTGGLLTCYLAALPFFDNSLTGDFLFSGALFGIWALAEKRFPSLRAATA